MNEDAPIGSPLAARLSQPFAAEDAAVNALHDRLNQAVPWLWWPLAVPSSAVPLARSEHALYAVHAALGVAAVTRGLPRRWRSGGIVVGAALAVGSWALFTGAWDRRAR